jgi:hypothetical protein
MSDQTCELYPTSTSCEYLQARIQTQYYIQYTLDLFFIGLFIFIITKIITTPNWISDIMKKAFKTK